MPAACKPASRNVAGPPIAMVTSSGQMFAHHAVLTCSAVVLINAARIKPRRYQGCGLGRDVSCCLVLQWRGLH